MRNFLILAVAALALTQIACKKGDRITTAHGNGFINHTNKSGTKIKSGDLVSINVYTWVNDSLVQSTIRDNGGPRDIQIPDTAAFRGRFPAVFDGLFQMTEGDSATIYQPLDSVMKKGIPPSFGEVKEIRYDIVAVNVLDDTEKKSRETEEAAKQAIEEQKMQEAQKNAPMVKARGIEVAALVKSTLASYKGNKLGDKLQKTGAGMEYIILEKGTGAPIKDKDEVPTHYYGVLKADGKMFDNSFDRGQSLPFTVGAMIPGFNEGMKLINRGGKAILFIPYALAYGEQGSPGGIPPKSDLVFYLEVEP